MRNVIRKDCSYEQYAEMVDWIDRMMPHAVISVRYNDRLKQATLSFWDSDYIPEDWRKWVVLPPKHPKTEYDFE